MKLEHRKASTFYSLKIPTIKKWCFVVPATGVAETGGSLELDPLSQESVAKLALKTRQNKTYNKIGYISLPENIYQINFILLCSRCF